MGESSAGWVLFWISLAVSGRCLAGNVHFLRAQCYSFCLIEHADLVANSSTGHVEESQANKKSDPLLDECNYVQDCHLCSQMCKWITGSKFSSQTLCQDSCQYFYVDKWKEQSMLEFIPGGCESTCQFIHHSQENKLGSCPQNPEVRGLLTKCPIKCHSDSDCSVNKKCCAQDCGTDCKTPVNAEILPMKPSKVRIKEKKDDRVMITWSDKNDGFDTNSAPPQFYLIQYRWGRKERRHEITSKKRFTVVLPYDNYYKGATYKFRVAAININGSLGYSKIVTYEQPVHKPGKPENLMIERTEFSDAKISLTLSWQPPRPVSVHSPSIDKYQILWLRQPEVSPLYERQNFSQKVVPSDINRCILPNLEPDSYYTIYVKALVKSSKRRIVGDAGFLHVKTDSKPMAFNPVLGNKWSMTGHNSDIQNVSVSESFIHKGMIKATVTWQSKVDAMKFMIYWKAENCAQSSFPSHFQEKSATSHSPEFNLFNLHYGCDYLVRILTVNQKGETGPAAYASFKTPPCSKIQVKGQKGHLCPVFNEDTLDPPEGMMVEIEGDHCEHLLVKIKWEAEWKEGRKYMVKWGRSQESSNSHIIYTSQLHNIISSGNVGEVILYAVEFSQHYTVQLSVLSIYGDGRPVIKNFKTPDKSCPSTKQHTTTATSSTTTITRTTIATFSENSPDKKPGNQSHVELTNNAPNLLNANFNIILLFFYSMFLVLIFSN